ncbi:MAG: Rpn family recombination-promoting nuclease/putative transposase, partial [Lentisphaeria bacterium]|nr:Rpn family recombination-promoting nuclease/putative transposase [Lentisphaeria bacterium]
MGRKDMAAKVLMKRNDVFADAFNVLFWRAGLSVDAGSLVEMNPEIVVPLGRRRGGWMSRMNDLVNEGIVRRMGGTDCVLMCLENQSEVALDMPLRNLLSAGGRWEVCRERQEERNLAEGRLKDGAEFLSGLRRGELLPPVVVLALYLGREPWSGPMRLQDMVDVRNPELRAFMADCPANVVSLVDLAEEEVSGMRSHLRPLSWLLRTQDDDEEMLRKVRADPLFLDAPSVLYRTFNELTGADLTVPRQKEHNNMCLAIEKMKEKGRREERKKALKALDEEREKSSRALDEEREKSSRALDEEREKSSRALDEEREKSSRALEEERKNGIYNLITTCRD